MLQSIIPSHLPIAIVSASLTMQRVCEHLWDLVFAPLCVGEGYRYSWKTRVSGSVCFSSAECANCFHWLKYVVYVSFIDIRPFKWNMYGTDESVGVSATSDFSLLVQVVSYMRTS